MPVIYDNEVIIYENLSALPRAYVSYGFKKYSSAGEARRMSSKKIVALTTDPPAGFTSKKDSSIETALIKKDEPNRVVIEASLSRPGILVLTDTFYPGWSVHVDGEVSDIELVNGIVRGVFLDKGAHSIVFNYMPASFKRGLALFTLALIISILLLIPIKKRAPVA